MSTDSPRIYKKQEKKEIPMKTPLIALFVPILIAVLLLSCSKSTEPQTCANPVFSKTSGTYNNELFVTISCETPGAVIRYTTNGSDPTESSNQYNSGITINTTTTLKAKAFKSGWNPSTTTSATYTIIQSVATPVFSPDGGTYYPSVSVSITCSTSGATIRYTTNGSNPTSSSPIYSSPISITSTTTLKAKAFKSGWNESAIANSSYSIEMPQTVATPTFNPSGGTYNSTQSVTMSCSTPGATIRYTINGSTPTSSSPQYPNPVTISATTTLKARAFRSGWYDSEIASAVYTIDTTPTVATPTFNPPGGSYSSPQNVTISCSTSGATIRYTTNGSNPTSLSPTYTSPISVTSSTTIKAKAFKSGWNDSQVASASYNIQGPLLTEIGSYLWTPNNVASCVRVVGNYAYVGAGTRLRIMDVSQPSNITELGSCYVDTVLEIKVSNGYAYIAALTSGLKIVDISNPSNPFVVGSLDTPGYAQGVDVVGNRAYVCDEAYGLHIIDVSNPSSPSFVGNYDSPGFANGVTVNNGIAYLADWSGGIRIVNVNNSSSPYELSYIFPASEADCVVYSNSVLYVGGPNMVCALNVANVSSPFELWSYSTEYSSTVYSVRDLDLHGNRLFIAASLAGTRILDTSNSSSIQEIGYVQTNSSTAGIDYSNGRLYVADGSGGLRIFQVNSRY
ncbi:MAG: chitobiase/beta-hexosaminidase C-terminal domain-containing protein [Proteiniphilum sp.]|nr:chitobiase/beta-hexosaminidase C-terminal domain-containing protein [Proteiniphilum sp.]